MPARRSGASEQKSASQRLCALMPAHRSSYSSLVGGRATTMPVGKNGGTVFGKITSATWPSAQRRESSQFRVRLSPWRSRYGFL